MNPCSGTDTIYSPSKSQHVISTEATSVNVLTWMFSYLPLQAIRTCMFSEALIPPSHTIASQQLLEISGAELSTHKQVLPQFNFARNTPSSSCPKSLTKTIPAIFPRGLIPDSNPTDIRKGCYTLTKMTR